MKAWLAIGLLVVVFQAVPKQADKPHANQNASKNLSEQPKQPARGASPNIPLPEPSPEPKEGGANREAKQSGWREKLISPVVSNWPLIAVAIWGILVARSTLHAIKWQAEETANATKAMRDSLEVTVAENRPWLLPHLQEGKDRIQEPYLKPVGSVPQAELRFSHCVFFFKNYGQTPAKALMLRAELRIGDNPTEPPSSDIYDVTEVKFNPFIFPQGEAVPHSAQLTPDAFITDRELDDITNGIRFLWLQGIVRYRHTIETETLSDAPDFETKFCYVWETRLNTPKPIWRLAGPAGTNTAT